LRSAAFFEGVLQKALHRLKYHHDQILADSLGALLARHWRATQVPGEMIVPVPLSAERLRERGYNQAALLARGLAELTNKAFRPQALQRVRHTVSQVGLSAEARRANVVGAFVADSRAVRGRAVLVIDDVCTTGSTLVACAEALRQAGATTVWGYTLGRARAFHTGSTRQAPTAPSASETFSRETSPQRSLRDREAIH
jgi:ComF family protein